MATYNDSVKIQVLIQEPTQYGQFNDAIYYTPEEFAALTDEQVTTAKQARVDNWVNIVSTPSEPVQETAEDLIAQVAILQQQFQVLQNKMNSPEFADAPELVSFKVTAQGIGDILSNNPEL